MNGRKNYFCFCLLYDDVQDDFDGRYKTNFDYLYSIFTLTCYCILSVIYIYIYLK